MVEINKVLVSGNLTKDPEIIEAKTGRIVNARLAINRNYKDANGNRQSEVCFIDLKAYPNPNRSGGGPAETMANYCKKGRAVLVEGRLSYDEWTSKEDGKKKSKNQIIVERIQFLDAPPAFKNNTREQQTQQIQQIQQTQQTVIGPVAIEPATVEPATVEEDPETVITENCDVLPTENIPF